MLKLRRNQDRLFLNSQLCIEFWSTATRPAASNGLGLTLVAADHQLRFLERIFSHVPDHPAIYAVWRKLILARHISGKQVHDARLAAVMLTTGITHILTFNSKDFARYASDGITAIDPSQI